SRTLNVTRPRVALVRAYVTSSCASPKIGGGIGTSAMPQRGHIPGLDARTSGCIGHQSVSSVSWAAVITAAVEPWVRTTDAVSIGSALTASSTSQGLLKCTYLSFAASSGETGSGTWLT